MFDKDGFYNAIIKWFESNGKNMLTKAGLWLSTAAGAAFKALLIIIIGWWIASLLTKAVSSALQKGKADPTIHTFACSCTKFVLRAIVLISAVAALGINITSIITALGAAGITLGLAMQDSLSNFASGVLILFNRPFTTGDYIEFEGSSGTVERIELMTTTLRTPDNKHVVYPNSKLTAEKLINYTAQSDRRLDLQFSVAYGTDIQLVSRLLKQVCSESPLIYNDKPVTVGINKLAEHSIVVDLRAWIDSSEYWEAYYDVQERVNDAFAENGVVIPFNQLDVHIANER